MSKDVRDKIDTSTGISKTTEQEVNREFYALEEAIPMPENGQYCSDKFTCEEYKKLRGGEKCPVPRCGNLKPL